MWQGHQFLPGGEKRRQNYSGIGSIVESSHKNQSENDLSVELDKNFIKTFPLYVTFLSYVIFVFWWNRPEYFGAEVV